MHLFSELHLFTQRIFYKSYFTIGVTHLFILAFLILANPTEAQLILDRTQVLNIAQQRNWMIRDTSGMSKTLELQHIKNNIPLYYKTTNINAADTVSTDECWPGGSLGLSLSGAGVTLGVWDAGRVRALHNEFTGRSTQRDGRPALNFHSTHVAGTMIAAGVWPGSPPERTRGMSFEADLDSYDWNSDETEMSNAATNGLLVSNHSYGFVTGWEFGDFGSGTGWYWFGDVNISTFEDYFFGFYSFQSMTWDLISHQHPTYLIVTSAGNDRNDVGPGTGGLHYFLSNGFWVLSNTTRSRDGNNGFDSMSHASIAKNVLSVGAVSDIPGGYNNPLNVVAANFSSYGPADDGRIKPDIVANGISLLSSSSGSNSDYITLSGTSMSSPSVAGSIGILIQHYRDTHNFEDMLAATVKGLIIHTADEAGTDPGPDYRFGWGLLNTRNAVEHITLDQSQPAVIQELTITQGQGIEESWTYSGSGPIRATICWTDPAGIPVADSLDPPDKMLVNDLDMKIIGPLGTVYESWMMNPLSPAAPATTGNNNADNVEMVHIELPTAGDYTFQITHKGTLRNAIQNFSLLLSGIEGAGVLLGACCDGETCTSTTDKETCDLAGGTWYGGSDCANFTCPPIGACCTGCSPVTSCEPTILTDCLAIAGQWQEGVACVDTDCSLKGDDCSSDILVVSDGSFLYDNTCADTDGPLSVSCESGPQPFTKDLWYSYTATCTGIMTTSLCNGTLYDAILAVYTDGSATCPCPNNSTTQFDLCADDTCGIGGGPATLERSVIEGQCYTIRVGGWNNESGSGTLNISCDVINAPDPLSPDPIGPGGFACDQGSNHGVLCSSCVGGDRDLELCYVDADCSGGACVANHTLCPDGTCVNPAPYRKNRFISMIAPDTTMGQQTAIRITLIDVPNFPGMNGETRWLGVPSSFFDTTIGGEEFTASRLQCSTFFRDWTADLNTAGGLSTRAIGVIHAYGPEVAPGSIYQAQMTTADCLENLNIEACFSDPLTIYTAKWGDVILPLVPATNSTQPTIADMLALVDKWLGSSEPSKVRSRLEPRIVLPDLAVSIADILRGVDAWLGSGYPFDPPDSCP